MVVEVTTFRVSAGTDDAALVDADARWQEALMLRASGFVRRTFGRSVDDARGWAAISLWGTLDDAIAAQGLASADAAGQAFYAFAEEGTIEVRRYTALDR